MHGHITVINPGIFTTLQGQGRYAYAHLGVPIGGAMDMTAAQLANTLVGNCVHETVLEVTGAGLEFTLDVDCTVAVAGAEHNVLLDNKKINGDQTILMRAGAYLKLSALHAGFRSYVAFSGGIDTPSLLGSGGSLLSINHDSLLTRPISKGDKLKLKRPSIAQIRCKNPWQKVQKRSTFFVHTSLGPDLSFFSHQHICQFFAKPYTITADSNRMGYRLTGEPINYRMTETIKSTGLVAGSIQVTPDGGLILAMRDAQATGGYPRICVVDYYDVNLLAQAKAGDRIWFTSY